MKAEIVVPSSLDDITLEQYQLFMRIVSEEDSEEFLAQKMVSVFCKIRLSDVFKIRMLDVLEIATSIGEMIQKSCDLTPRFKMNDTEFGFIPDLENISFEEYVDLDSHLGDWQTMHKAMAVMYRPIVKTKRDKYDIEEYQGSITYSEVMKYAPLSIVLGSMVFFLSFKGRVVESYPKLFKDGGDGDGFSAEEQFNKQWGWYNSIYQLAGGNIAKFDEVTKLPLFQCLTYLTYEKQKNEIEMRKLKNRNR